MTKQRMIRKILTLIPSAFNHKAMGDIANFISYYKDIFSIVIISDLYKEELIEENDIKYVRCRTHLSDYYIYTSDYIIDAGAINRHSRVWAEQKRISVWHGIPYKKMFIDLDDRHISSTLNYQNCYDVMVSPSEFYTKKFLNKSMLYNGNVLEVGSSRCDSLFIDEAQKTHIRSQLEIESNKKIVLYAPTYRELGQFDIPFSVQSLLSKLGNDYVLIVKVHYLNTVMTQNEYFIDATHYCNVNELLSISDILITDYSSLFFDFSVINNKVIFFQYDKELYTDDRGFMFDLKEYIDNRLICNNEADLLDAVSLINSGVEFKNTIKENFYPYADGKDTSRIVNQLALDSQPRTHKDIVLLVNELNNIGGIHTFISSLSKLFKDNFNCKIILISLVEFNHNYNGIKRYESKNIDMYLSLERESGAIKSILSSFDGYIISTQFSAHKKLQPYIKDKNVLLMFHGDIKDVISRNYYHWHYDAIRNTEIYNYKKILLLSKSNMKLLNHENIPFLNNRIDYIYNPFFSSMSNLYKQNGVFVAVTRLDDDKNIFDLLDIFSHKDINPMFSLDVYGDGALYSEFKDEIEKRNLSNKVRLRGYESNKNIIFKEKQGLIFTSVSEGFPYIILESFNYGIPVYTYGSFTAVNDVMNEEVGVIIKHKDIDSYVSSLNQTKEFEFQCFEKHMLKFSPESTLNKWLSVFNESEELTTITSDVNYQNKLKLKKKINIKQSVKKYLKKVFKKLSKPNKVRARSLHAQLFELFYLIKLKNKPLVSVVMPFYNNASTIENAVLSIYKQKYKNIEILIVNDGSNYDEKPLLKKFSKIKYFYQNNMGPGLARNLAVDNAKGKYLFYLDSDDTIPRAALTALVHYAEKYKLNMVMGKKSRIQFNNKQERHIWMPSIYKKNYINERHDRFKLLMESTSTGILFNLSELRESGIRWESGLYEDKLYSLKTYNFFDQIGVLNHYTYNWLVYGDNSSITTSINIDNFKERYARLLEIWELLDEKGRFYYYHQVISHDFKIYINNYQRINNDDRFELYLTMREFLIKHKSYFYKKNVVNIISLEIITAIFNDNFERFDKIASVFSNHYLTLYK